MRKTRLRALQSAAKTTASEAYRRESCQVAELRLHFSACLNHVGVLAGAALVILVTLAWLLSEGHAAETNQPPIPPGMLDQTNSQELIRVYQQLQEQVRAAQLAIDQSRQEAKEAAAQNAEVLSQRLHAIEQALATQRARELEAMQSSNRVMLMVAGSFACVGFLVMLVAAYFQWRTVNGLAGISALLPAGRLPGPGPAVAALGPAEGPLVSARSAEQSNLRLLGALEQLEKRIYELEHTARVPLTEAAPAVDVPTPEPERSAGVMTSMGSSGGASADSVSAKSDRAAWVETLLGKGLSKLNLDQAEGAIECFDKVLALDPQSAEALVRKGLALERLQMLNEAIECYDRAIAADSSMTIAYLHKGGLFNRMERYEDALACYEQALRTQEKHES